MEPKLLLTIDVGNTTISLGLFREEELVEEFRLSTLRERTPDELGMEIAGLLNGRGITPERIAAAMVCSVVPPLNPKLVYGLKKHLDLEPQFLDHSSSPIELAVEEPLAVGPDRIADSIAAYHLFGGPVLVIDFGTAMTFDLVSEDGKFLGGAIAPEMELTAEMLVRRTALLPEVDLHIPTSVIGKTTAENLRAGFVLGFLELIRGLIRRFQEEYGKELRVIATGGKGEFFAQQLPEIERYEPYLTLHGLRIAWELRKGQSQGQAQGRR